METTYCVLLCIAIFARAVGLFRISLDRIQT